MDYVMNGRVPERMGNRSHWYAPQGCYRCKGDDNWLAITVRNDAEWEAFCNAAGHAEWASDRRFADVLARFENHDALDDAISAWTAERDHDEAMDRLQRAGVIAAAVHNPKQVLLDPHLKERGYFQAVDTKTHGTRPVPRQVGARFSAFETDSARTSPKLGEHNEEILKGLLGMSDAEVAELKEKGVIGDEPQTAVPLPVMRMFVQWPTTTYLQMGALAGLETDYKDQLGISE
jgi:benzylsuccinate CoA-transferase BbsF subunit